MQGLYDLPIAWLNYLREQVALPWPSVEKIKGFTDPSLGHFTTLFSGLRAALQLCHGRHANSVSWFAIVQLPSSSLNPCCIVSSPYNGLREP